MSILNSWNPLNRGKITVRMSRVSLVSRKARLERKRFPAYVAYMLLRSLLMCPLMSREVVSSSKGFPTVTFMVPLLKMHCVNVHLHVRPLTKIAITIFTHPFLLATMSCSNMPLQRIYSVERIRTVLTVIVAPVAVLG